MKILDVNIIFALSLFFISFLFCIIPKIVIQNKFINKLYYLLNIFIGGIQLATLFVDFFSHFVFDYSLNTQYHNHSHHSHHNHHNHSYHNLAPFIAIGYIFILLFGIDVLFLHNNKKENKYEAHNHYNHHNHHNCSGIHSCNSQVIKKTKTALQSVILLIVVSFHSLFEGMVVSKDQINMLYCFGLIIHKILESFALGVSIFASNILFRTSVILMLIYSMITPIGIILSLSLLDKFKSIKIWIDTLSLGSLMYIIFIEIIAHSFKDGKNTRKKLFMLFAGYTLGSLIIQMVH